ncbi:hypothetical protein AK812_SmicGene13702 [Symbiodinium microadriaticum]|uniref:Uncharacterized protein n=1 Tax=Symbiodinium microadriaticum TaxID=2951 RepID=A0A1Q9E7I8_SYMMI|nr:hypothetical protein AK812_SmicGene13702 [Symbiodinium microadriaticum]
MDLNEIVSQDAESQFHDECSLTHFLETQAAICHEPLDARLLRLALQEAEKSTYPNPRRFIRSDAMTEERKQQVPAAQKSWYLRVQSNMSSLLNVHHLPPTRVLGSVLRRVKNPGPLSPGEPKKASCKEVFTAFWTLFIPYFLHRRTRCRAFFLLSVTVVFMYLEVSTGVAIAAQTKELQNSLVLQKKDEFWGELSKLVLIIARNVEQIQSTSLMSSAALHPMASLTDSECERLDAIIRAVGNRLDRQLRKNGEDPDEGDIFECATAAVVAYVDDRAEDNIFRPVAKAKAGPARGTKRALG